MPWIRFKQEFVHHPTALSTQYFQPGQEMCAPRRLVARAIAAGAAEAIEKPNDEPSEPSEELAQSGSPEE